MNEYSRFISYIYAYPGDVKDKNVGFVKVEVRNGQCRLDMTLNGIYMDASKVYGVYLMVKDDGCALVKLGNVLANSGTGKYKDLLNPENMNGSGFSLSDGIGIAVLEQEDTYYRMFSLWNDDAFKPSDVHFYEKEKQEEHIEEISEINLLETPEVKAACAEPVESLESEDESIEDKIGSEDNNNKVEQDDGFLRLIKNGEIMDIFEDDDLYDCIEVSPEQLKKAVENSQIFDDNSFMMHGFFRFHHLLLGRVVENDNNTKYFIGIPGMYCNRERYMASVFGFGNFKKSHRSDYNNPYFGYWYQEI